MKATMKTRVLLVIPLLGFGILVFFLAIGFGLERHQVHPSALLNKPFPQFARDSLLSEQTITHEDLKGSFHLVNVWASWCVSCIEEHKLLLEIAASDSVSVVGINYKDNIDDAKTWLAQRGNPYEEIIVDQQGELCVDLGVYGAPETFLVDPKGIIRAKQVGVLTHSSWVEEFQPLLTQLGQN